MKLRGRDLSVRMRGEDVKQLLSELRQLGFAVAEAEVAKNLFGKTARQAVIEFQKAHGLAADGVVGEVTAKRLGIETARRKGAPDGAHRPPAAGASVPTRRSAPRPPANNGSKTCAIQGQVRQTDGQPAAGVTVRAFDQDGRDGETMLGESVTDQDGLYKITYAPEVFRRLSGERTGFDMILRVLDPTRGTQQDVNAVRVARPVETVNFDIPWPPGAAPSQSQAKAEPTPFRVEGQVRRSDGRRASGLIVRAFDRDLRNEQELGKAVTDREGGYQIRYSASQLRRADKGGASLIVRVFGKKGETLASSPIVFNAQPVEVVGLTIGDEESRSPDEYQQLLDEITPLLDGAAISELTEDKKQQDVTFLSGETRIEEEKLIHLIAAHKLYERSNLEPEFWYALLRGKLFVDAPSAAGGPEEVARRVVKQSASLRASMVEYALGRALKTNIINARHAGSQADWLARYRDFIAEQLLASDEAEEPAQVRNVSDLSGLKAKKREQFARHYLGGRANRAEVVNRLRDDGAFSPKEIGKVEAALLLDDLTLGNAPLVRGLAQRASSPSDVRKLARLRPEDWKARLKESGVSAAPAFIAGDSPRERADNYAAFLAQKFQEAYPTAAFAGGLERAVAAGEEVALKHADLLGKVLNSHPEFELQATAVEEFVNEKAGPAVFNSRNRESLIQELKAVQRVFKLAPSFEATNTLLAGGLHSAQQIYRMGETKFVRAFADKPGFTEATARDAFQRAANTNAAVLTLVGELRATESANEVFALVNGAETLSDFPNLQNLFGKADICECEHCRSVYSPSAYFADVLMFLTGRDSRMPPASVKDVLFKRRPDIGHLELSCENSNTPLPYIDLACEVLEDQVAPWRLFDLPLTLEPSLKKGPVEEAVRTAFGQATPGVKLSAEAVVSEKLKGDYWVIHDTGATYKVAKGATALAVSVLRQTHGTADELAANPEYVNAAVYLKLAKERYPLALPFDLFTEELRAYLEQVNVRRADLMQVYRGTQPPNNPTPLDTAAEYFGISKAEQRIILSADLASQSVYWGAANPVTEVGKVDVFLNKTGLEYDDILKLLSLKFINEDVKIKIVHLDSSCDTSQKRLQVLDDDKLDRIHRFLRLWRKLGWEMWEVDLAVSVIGGGSINETFIERLKAFAGLREKLPRLTIEQLCGFFGDLNTKPVFTASFEKPEPSLYEQLFLNKKLTNPIDEKFRVEAVTVPAPTEKMDAHVPPILAALGIKGADLGVFRALNQPANGPAYIDDKLRLKNLSFLYRHALLARSLNFNAAEWRTLLYVAQLDPFRSPQVTLDFVNSVERIRASGFSLDELSYVLTANLAAKSAQAEKNVTVFLTDLRRELQKIAAENGANDLPPDAEGLAALLTAQLQKLGWDAASTGSVLAILKDEFQAETTITSLPANFEFPEPIAKSIRISYNDALHLMRFTGLMTAQEKDTLLNNTSIPVAVRNNSDYKKAINDFHDGPRLQLKFFRREFATPLAKLPASISFAEQLPKELAAKVFYDVEQLQLRFAGFMTLSEKAALDNLSADAAYRSAVDNLHNLPNSGVFPADELWLKDSDLQTPLPAKLTVNLQTAVTKMAAYLKRTLSESLVVQQFGASLDTPPAAARKLLTTYKFFGTPTPHTLLEDFTGGPFPSSTSAITYTDAAYKDRYDTYYWLHRVALVIRKMAMSFTDLEWVIRRHAQTEVLNLESLPLVFNEAIPAVAPLDKFLNLSDYMRTHHRYSSETVSLLNIVERLIGDASYNQGLFGADVELLTGWPAADVKYLTGASGLDAAYPAAYLKISGWQRLAEAVSIAAKLNGAAPSVAKLAAPVVDEPESQLVKQLLRSKYEADQWLDLSKGIQDRMRERKRDSLVAYLLTQPMPAGAPTLKWDSAGDLYAHYLIDVEMSACQPTSRIVQASAAAQLFVQRCFMGLEPEVRVSAEEDDVWKQWKWMKNYRVWEANRKVFLYPENWAEPELRRDKSPFFSDLENELLQNEVNRDNVETAFLNYIEKLNGVAHLEIAGTYYQEDNHTLHVFARTPGSEPHAYYYRQWIDDRRWTPWSKVDCDIKGDYLVPLVMEQRLYLAWPEFREEPKEVTTIPVPSAGDPNFKVQKPIRILHAHLAISEYRNKKWSPKKVSKDSVVVGQADVQTFDTGGYLITPLDFTDEPDGKFLILIATDDGAEGFELLGCKGYPEKTTAGENLSPLLTRFDRDQFRYLKSVEFQQDDLLVPQENVALVEPILGKTPDFFKVTYPHYMSFFDKLFFSKVPQPFVRPGDGEALTRLEQLRAKLTLGTFYNWFYADKARTFFVRPHLLAANGATLFYKEFVALVKQAIMLSLAGRLDELREMLVRMYPTGFRFQLLFRNFYHPFACLFAKQLYTRGVDGLMSRETQFADNKLDFRLVYEPTPVVRRNSRPGEPYEPAEVVDFEPDGSYSQYNWELFFHAPLMIATQLSKNQRFEEAMQWFHYIFDPTGAHDKDPVTGNPAPAPQRYWITKKFYQTTSKEYADQRIENILKMLTKDPSNPTPRDVLDGLVRQVADWRANPFDPHVVAQFRTVAYQKATVMKYIDNLIAWGDQLFRQDTMESVNEAAQLYILAAEILGPRPRKVPPAKKPAVETFNELEDRLDAFSNAVVNFENLVPSIPRNGEEGSGDAPLPSLLYFCIPQNDKMLGYWDTVADRLYKIRHCLNIEGVFRQLALFAPPIDPALLVKAAAAGVDISAALSGLGAPLPHYRFGVILQKANEVAGDVKALGNALLVALEKKDAEALALLRQSHELKVLEAVRVVREQQVAEAKQALEGLKKSEEVIISRREHYANLKRVSPSEKLHQEKLLHALIAQQAAQAINVHASIAHIIPSFSLGVVGVGGTPEVTASFGGSNVGSALQAMAGQFTFLANIENYLANKAAINASHERRWEEWKFQEMIADRELGPIRKQIAAAEIRVKIAESELKNHELQIENSRAVDAFMRSKYTSRELYEWMVGQISQVYFQSYQLAYDLAKRAERCYQHELGVENSSFIKFGYWDSLKKGLLSGEKLQYDLRRLDAAYLEQNRREFELTKHVSLALVSPAALLQLKETGSCFFDLPEELFDLDYQGHYFRRIKSVGVSIPCVAGPHTTVGGTLRLIKNSVRVNTRLDGQYEHNHDDGVFTDDPRFRESSVVIKSIATSSGQNDGGMFDLNFRDERYLPFEGAGAVSSWKLELTAEKGLRQFDYDSISDVIVHLRYTAREDAGKFKTEAVAHLKATVAAASSRLPLTRLFNLKHEFPTEWYAFFNPPAGAVKRLALKLRKDHFPFLAQEKDVVVEAISLYVKSGAKEDFVAKLEPPLDTLPPPPPPATRELKLTRTPSFGDLYWSKKAGLSITFDETITWLLRLRKLSGTFDTITADDVEECFMVVEYNVK